MVPKTPAVSPSMLRHCRAAVTLCRASNAPCFARDPHQAPSPSALCSQEPSHRTPLPSTGRSTVAHVLAPLTLSWRKLNSDKERRRNIRCWRSRTISCFHPHFFPSRLFTSRVILEPLGIPHFSGVPITGLSEKKIRCHCRHFKADLPV